MPLTATELNQRALLLLSVGQQNSAWLDQEVEANQAITLSLHELGRVISQDESRFGQLQQDYSVALTAGAGNLATAVGSLTTLADIIWESVKNGRVKDSEGVPLLYIPDVFSFEAYVLPGYNYFHIRASQIFTRGSSGSYIDDFNKVTGALLVTANYTPSIGNLNTLPADLEPDLIQIHANTLATKFQSKLSAKNS